MFKATNNNTYLNCSDKTQITGRTIEIAEEKGRRKIK